MGFPGGLLVVVAAALWWSLKHRQHFFDVADFIAPLVPPGLGFGRLGNYINGELWGKFTGGGWGVVFPQAPEVWELGLDPAALRAQFETGALDAFARHPSQLYQAALQGLAMFRILWWYSRNPRPRYAVAGLFALLYGVFRFAVAFVRLPDTQLGYIALGCRNIGQVLNLPLTATVLDTVW